MCSGAHRHNHQWYWCLCRSCITVWQFLCVCVCACAHWLYRSLNLQDIFTQSLLKYLKYIWKAQQKIVYACFQCVCMWVMYFPLLQYILMFNNVQMSLVWPLVVKNCTCILVCSSHWFILTLYFVWSWALPYQFL